MDEIERLRDVVRQAEGRLWAAKMAIKADEEFPDRAALHVRNSEALAKRKAELDRAQSELTSALGSAAI
jgi:hypothetical protein